MPPKSWDAVHHGPMASSATKTVKKLSPFWMNARCRYAQSNPKVTVVRTYRVMTTASRNALPDLLDEETGKDITLVYGTFEEDRRTCGPKSDGYDKCVKAYGHMRLMEGRRGRNNELTLE